MVQAIHHQPQFFLPPKNPIMQSSRRHLILLATLSLLIFIVVLSATIYTTKPSHSNSRSEPADPPPSPFTAILINGAIPTGQTPSISLSSLQIQRHPPPPPSGFVKRIRTASPLNLHAAAANPPPPPPPPPPPSHATASQHATANTHARFHQHNQRSEKVDDQPAHHNNNNRNNKNNHKHNQADQQHHQPITPAPSSKLLPPRSTLTLLLSLCLLSLLIGLGYVLIWRDFVVEVVWAS